MNIDLEKIKKTVTLNDEEILVLKILQKYGHIDEQILEKETSLDKSKIRKILDLLIIKNVLIPQKRSKSFCDGCPFKNICYTSKNLNDENFIYTLNNNFIAKNENNFYK
ncbi:MAG: hypothetical protein C0177_04945 [Fervidicoccus fontis]|uniref:Uncharacterized protein n=1 Tax=Fervidicoccus fontis TaxID=683846 RepID=A0A7C2VAD4_9CREN|nr:MAG: hypothetical protein C0177_04945 [Fervidicoccus fontis]HEW63620.1 hypothetical protein [Fervidicoccus fontis]